MRRVSYEIPTEHWVNAKDFTMLCVRCIFYTYCVLIFFLHFAPKSAEAPHGMLRTLHQIFSLHCIWLIDLIVFVFVFFYGVWLLHFLFRFFIKKSTRSMLFHAHESYQLYHRCCCKLANLRQKNESTPIYCEFNRFFFIFLVKMS